MSQEELLGLINEYNFTDEEIKDILSKITSRDFETVASFLDEYEQSKKNPRGGNENSKTIEEIKKRAELQKIEKERIDKYKKMLLEQIAANRKEQREKEKNIIAEIKEDETEIKIDSEIKVRLFLPQTEAEMYFGFSGNSTVKDLYEKVRHKVSTVNFKLAKFGKDNDVVEMSDEQLYNVFGAKSFMLELLESNK